MSVASIHLFFLLAYVASASENSKPLVEHSIRVDGHVKCGGVPVENATVSLVFVVPNKDVDPTTDGGYDPLQPVQGAEGLGDEYPSRSSELQSGPSVDYAPGNASATVYGVYDYPENLTDAVSDHATNNADSMGSGALLASKNTSRGGNDGIDDYYSLTPEEMRPPSELEDVLDSTLTVQKGAYHVDGKILYAAGDESWKLHLKIVHKCDNGTIQTLLTNF